MIQALYTYKIKKTLYFAENGQMKFKKKAIKKLWFVHWPSKIKKWKDKWSCLSQRLSGPPPPVLTEFLILKSLEHVT